MMQRSDVEICFIPQWGEVFLVFSCNALINNKDEVADGEAGEEETGVLIDLVLVFPITPIAFTFAIDSKCG
ncbi:MAG: hypothetical protein LBV71_19185 [Prevotella sp.]|jgi:hypothetical protein|nr:hypothetical protein [Prevotella sp.]